MGDLRIELNVALLPDPGLAGKLAVLSSEFAGRYPALVRLGDAGPRLTLAPHLTLYQVPVPLTALAQLHAGLSEIAAAGRSAELSCERFAYNKGEDSLEAQTEITGDLISLQQAVIALANPIRAGRLLERDPAGNRVEDLLRRDDMVGRNIRHTGYAEAGALFRPHYTLNWFVPGAVGDEDADAMERDVDPAALAGRCTALGMFALGPNGTCPQLLARYEFGG